MIKQLQQMGLSPFQSEIYWFLTNFPDSAASRISRQTKIQRSMVYVVLSELQDLKLVTRDDTRKIARFKISDPEALQMLISAKENEIKLAKSAHGTISSQVKQQYMIQSGQPGVRFYSGTEGLKNLYADINASEAKTIYLVRSRTKPSSDMLDIIVDQVNQQKKKGVLVRVINSTIDNGIKKHIHLDSDSGIERRVIHHEVFKNSAQIILYGNKVGFTTYADPTITVVIEHPDIAETISSMYQLVWRHTEKESIQNIDNITKDK